MQLFARAKGLITANPFLEKKAPQRELNRQIADPRNKY
jgi:hypothetical protein